MHDSATTSPAKSELNLIWIDLEMTGLDVDKDHIIEAAIVVTDPTLETWVESPAIAVQCSDEILSKMDRWNTGTHTRSGLVDRVKKSEYDSAAAEKALLAFVAQYVPEGK